MSLRNLVFIALAQDATPDEVENAHTMLDRLFGVAGNGNGVDPALLVASSTYHTPQQPAGDNTTGGAAAGTTALPEFDKTGLPYDERIHSSSKENRLNADGTWRAKRGVDKKYAAQIEAQIRASLAANGAAAATTTPPVSTPAPGAGAGGPPLPGGNLPPMPGASVETPYTELVKFIAANTKSQANPAGKFDDAYITAVLSHYGVADGSLQNLAHTPDLVPQVSTFLRGVADGSST